jgi:hypothetical protein
MAEDNRDFDGLGTDEFLWDDYSSDPNDRGVEVLIQHEGKILTFRIRRSLTIQEKQIANNAAIKIGIDKDNKPYMIGEPDQAAFSIETALAGLKAWPFTYSKGSPVPINRKTVSALDGNLLEKIAARILGITVVDPAALAPLEKK